MAKSSVGGELQKIGQDFFVSLCGFITSLLTAVILWQIEVHFGFVLYGLMLSFIMPIGAFLSGLMGASGYYVSSRLFSYRPTYLLLLNIVIVSVATFFLIYYLSYVTTLVEGKYISEYITFTQYLNHAIRSISMVDSHGEATGELYAFGYFIALLQIVGFATGGFVVYFILRIKYDNPNLRK